MGITPQRLKYKRRSWHKPKLMSRSGIRLPLTKLAKAMLMEQELL